MTILFLLLYFPLFFLFMQCNFFPSARMISFRTISQKFVGKKFLFCFKILCLKNVLFFVLLEVIFMSIKLEDI